MFKHLPSSFAWMAAAFAALGTLFFCIGLHTAYRNWQFSGPVVHVIGNVTGRHITVTHHRHGTSRSYYVEYNYFDPQGNWFTSNASVASSTYYRLTVPGSVPIKFLPAFHAINRIDLPTEDSNFTTQAWICTAAGGGFGGFGWFSLISLERLIFYRRWLRKNGIRCTGRVERLESANVTVNKRAVYYMVYTYTDPSGQTHEDSSEALSAVQEETWVEGNTIEIRCDPRDPGKSAAVLDRG